MKKVVILGLERNPFNAVQYEALREIGLDVTVIYTVSSNKVLNNTSWVAPFKSETYKTIESSRFHLNLFRNLFKRKGSVFVVYGYASWYMFASMLVCVMLGTKYLFFTDVPIPKTRVGFFKSIVRRFAQWLAYNKSSGVLTTGKSGRKVLTSMGVHPKKIINFPYAYGSIDFNRDSTIKLTNEEAFLECVHNRTIILFSSQLIFRKGLDLLLNALVAVKKSSSFILLVEGDGPQKLFFKDLVVKLGLTNEVIFLGFNSSKQHARYLALSDFVVSPSRWDPWGNIVSEGMSLGKAVIASEDVAAALDRITHNEDGLIYPSEDTQKLSIYIEALINDVELRERLGRNAQVASQFWHPQRAAISLSMYLNELPN